MSSRPDRGTDASENANPDASRDPSTDDDRGIDTEQDVDVDEATAASRATGGAEGDQGPDSSGTTGTGESGAFVGRVSGQDEGYAGLTGAEARALPDHPEGSSAGSENATGMGAAGEPPD